VSNFYVPYLERLLSAATVVPAINQIELHPYVKAGSCFLLFIFITFAINRLCQGKDVVAFCRKHGIIVTAYSPLGSDNSLIRDDPVVKEVAEKHGVNPSNVLISLQANREGVTGLYFYYW
jgi:glycerol 2-dehydrogenase (NADP+)